MILADCFEAVIGAIYLDQGYETAKDFIYKHILNKIDEILEDESWRDPKSYFQELAQKNAGVTPDIEDVISTATHFVLRKYKDEGIVYGVTEVDERGNCN